MQLQTVPSAFLSPCAAPHLDSGARSSFLTSVCVKRRPAAFRCSPRCAPSRTPTMMAKYQQQDDNSKQLDEETSLDKLIPPPAMPTLTTLSNAGAPEIDLSRLSEQPPSDAEAAKQSSEQDVAAMGAGLSAKDESAVVSFLKSLREEFFLIEWPTRSRVIKITLIIMLSLIVAVAALYVIDGFFYRMSQLLFEGQV